MNCFHDVHDVSDSESLRDCWVKCQLLKKSIFLSVPKAMAIFKALTIWHILTQARRSVCCLGVGVSNKIALPSVTSLFTAQGF